MTSVTVKTADGRTFECQEWDRIGIGGHGADVSIPDDPSNNRYAYIENRDGRAWIVPATPAIELRLNETAIDEAAPLRGGDELGVGNVKFSLDYSGQMLELVEKESGPTSGAETGNEQTAQSHATRRHGIRSGRVRLFKAVLLGIFLVLVMVLLFVFVATPISVSVTPEPERMEIRGFPPPLPLQDRYLALPGDYRVLAEKRGFESMDASISVARGGYTEFPFEMTKLPGRVSIYSRPDGADVSVGEKFLGPTPLIEKKLAAGPHRLVLSKERYQDSAMEIDVEGLDREQVFRIELAPDWAPVTFRSEPEGASVILGDEIAGVTPLTVDILSGHHQVGMELEKYQPESIELTVEAGIAMAAPVVRLTPVPANLRLLTKPPATVTVDGVYHGGTPLDLKLSPWEKHEIALASAGYETVKRTVAMEPGESDALSLELVPLYGVVFITSNPADATVAVDGRDMGPASQRLRLTARQHTLEFSKPGYESKRIELTPRPGVSKELSVELNPVGKTPSPVAAKPDLNRTGQGQELKLVTPGEFTMGSSRREQGHRANENLRRVVLTKPYYLSAREVTNGEFRRFRPEHSSGAAYGRSLDRDDQPVVNISWEDAVAYLNWLSAQDGLPPAYRKDGERWVLIQPPASGYRLPTEAEWARAARFIGSKPKKYAWGETYPPAARSENYADRSASSLLSYTLSSYDDANPVAAPVGSYSANEAGLYDLGGNVAEWVHDFYAVYPMETSAAAVDPRGPESGRHHVVRGAGWKDSTLSELRLSYRDYAAEPRNDLGFRIARYAD